MPSRRDRLFTTLDAAGARVENMIYMTEEGAQELTKCPLDLPMGF